MVLQYSLVYNMVGLGVRSFSKNGSNGAKIHFTSKDLEIMKWRIGINVEVEYNRETNTVTVKPVKINP